MPQPPISFPRTPYKVTYYKNGKKKTIRRVPPPKMHGLLPKDNVRITQKKGDDWDEGKGVKIKGVSQRQPNTLYVEDEDGKRTFLSFYDVEWENITEQRKLAAERGEDYDEYGSDYLLYP